MKNLLIGIISLFFLLSSVSCEKETSDYIKDLKSIKKVSENDVEARFSASTTYTSSTDYIYFTDESAGDDITSWYWDFGDGSYSTEQNPYHRYRYESGYMTVSLTVSNSTNSDTETKTDYIYIY